MVTGIAGVALLAIVAPVLWFDPEQGIASQVVVWLKA